MCISSLFCEDRHSEIVNYPFNNSNMMMKVSKEVTERKYREQIKKAKRRKQSRRRKLDSSFLLLLCFLKLPSSS